MVTPANDRFGGYAASSSSPINYTDTTTSTSGPRTDTQSASTVGGGTQSTSSSRTLNRNTSGAERTVEQIVRTVTQSNMDDESYGMLMQFLREQARGGSKEDKARRQEIWSEIAKNQAQRAGYSKEAAIIDSTAAAASQMSQALEQMLPAISSGIDAAGTSGSAMAALLSTQAAERVSRNAAQLQLEAAISYGQIANQSSGIIADLLRIDDKAADRFIDALNIAKGARVTTTDVTNRTQQRNWNEAISESERFNSTTNTSNWSNTNTVTTTGPQTDTKVNSRTYDLGSGGNSGAVGYTTPSSYRSGN